MRRERMFNGEHYATTEGLRRQIGNLPLDSRTLRVVSKSQRKCGEGGDLPECTSAAAGPPGLDRRPSVYGAIRNPIRRRLSTPGYCSWS